MSFEQLSPEGTGIRFIPKRPRASDEVGAGVSVPWKEEIEKVYEGALIDVANEFEECAILFPMIRKKNQWIHKTGKTALRELFKVCVILTDRGYLAAQTLDVLSHVKHTSYMESRIGYVSLPSKGEIHKKCRKKALLDAGLLWPNHFQDRHDWGQKARELLDYFYKRCLNNRSSVYEVVSSPDINDIEGYCDLRRDDSIYPDEQKAKIAELTTVQISHQEKKPAMAYFRQLCDELNIDFSLAELTFFVNEVLLMYCKQDRTIRTSKQEKHYHKVIGEQDREPVQRQASDCFNVFALSSTIFAIIKIGETKCRKASYEPYELEYVPVLCEEQVESFIEALTVHHNATHSARRKTEDEEELEIYFRDFVTHIEEDWELLCVAPYLIYLLWVSKEQNKYATRRSICLAKQIEDACGPRDIQSDNIPANKALFHFIVSLCKPKYKDSQGNWERAQLYLFEQAEAADTDGKTIGITRAYEKEVEKYRMTCLDIPLSCIPSYPSQIKPKDLKALITKHEVEITHIRETIINMETSHKNKKKCAKESGDRQSAAPDILDIMTATYNLFVDPDIKRYRKMKRAEESNMSAFSWDWLNTSLLGITPALESNIFKSPAAMAQYVKNAILEWCALQNIRAEKQKDLLSAFELLFSELKKSYK